VPWAKRDETPEELQNGCPSVLINFLSLFKLKLESVGRKYWTGK